MSKSDWFQLTWDDCYRECNEESSEVLRCAACWQDSILLEGHLPPSRQNTNIFNLVRRLNPTECADNESECETDAWRLSKAASISNCVGESVIPLADKHMPVIGERRSGDGIFKGKIHLPKHRSKDWWAIAVKLPCKPAAFSFQNAYCLNSASAPDGTSYLNSDDAEYLLTQNKLTNFYDHKITFDAVFTDACQFTADQVEILWDESFPAGLFPQVSSIPSSRGVELKQFVRDVEMGLNPIVEAELLYNIGVARRIKKFGTIRAPEVFNRRRRQNVATMVDNSENGIEWAITDYPYNYVTEQYMYDEEYNDDEDEDTTEDLTIGIELPCKVDEFNVTQSTPSELSHMRFRVIDLPLTLKHKSFKERHLISVSKILYAWDE